MTEVVMVEYPLSSLPLENLAGAYVGASLLQHDATALAISLCMAIQLEQNRREAGRDGTPNRPGDGFCIDFSGWSDRDIAQALARITVESFTAESPMATEFLNEVAKAIAMMAVFRLLNSSDPRNSVSFEERNRDPKAG